MSLYLTVRSILTYRTVPFLVILWVSFVQSANAECIDDGFRYWSGKYPTQKYGDAGGLTFFELLERQNSDATDPILMPHDLKPEVRWSRIEVVNVGLGNFLPLCGFFFTECFSASCSLSNPEAAWLVIPDYVRAHFSYARRSNSQINEFCRYAIGQNGWATGTGFGEWRCREVSSGEIRFPRGSGETMARELHEAFSGLGLR